ncbi:MAG: cadherin-like beta sandwich domain-containing protein [Prosthecobacter sp.]
MITGTTGVLTTNVSDLAPASSYTFKAYAITSAGISYSPAATFATLGQGDLDLAFGTGGKTTTAVDLDAIVSDVAVQSDGKVVITGSSSKMGIAPAVELVRFTSGGALDTSFGVNGRVTTSIGSTTSRGQAVVIQGDGKILVLADARAEGQVLPVVAVARYTSSGVLDSSFGNGGIVLTPTVATSSETAYASDLVLQSDGRIVVAGMITVGGVRSYMLLRYTTSGALDTSFGTGGKSIVPAGFINPASVAMQGDGKIVVAGGGLDVTQVFELARFTSNGALDTGFGTNGVVKTSFGSGYASALSVALQSDGKIVAAGKTSMSGGQAVALARYTAQGALDADFGAGGKLTTRISAEDEAQGVAVQSDGKIVVGGWTDNGSSVYYNNSFAVWRYTSTGALDTSFGSGGVAITSFGGGRDRATSLALGGDGTIVVAGTDDTNPGIYPTKYQFAVARYLGGAVPPSLTWPLSSSITVTGATLGGTVTGGGGAGVSERGIVYAPTATNSNPVIGGNGVVKVPVTGTTGAFTTAVTGLAPGTTYSYKAYATNPLGTSYTGAGVFTTTGSLPVVTTPTLAAVTLTSALLGGNVTQAGDAPVIERGVVYAPASVNDNPAIGGAGVTKVSVPGTTGVFTVNVTGLDVTTSHGFRAYAISALGVSYSSMLSFTTASNNANLAALSLSAGTLSPAFAPGTSSYTASVPNATTAITLTPASAQNHAAIFINNVRVMSGAASMSIPLELGENLVSTVVIASDAVTTRTYTVRVTRTALPVIILPGSGQVSTTSATLGATLTSTGFAAIEEQGIVIAPTAINDTPRIGGAGVIKLTNVAAFADRYEVSATGLTPGVRYSFAGFATNSEGTSYTSTGAFTTVSDDASLSALVLSAGTLSPGFSGSTTAYDCIVPNVTTSLTVTPTTTNANATIRVNNVVVASGSASPALSLHVGLNSITIAVTAPDGATIRTYTVAVTRQSVTENALDNWAAEKGLPPSAAGPLADADGDGVPNLMEFAFGTSPSANSSARMQFSGTFAGGVTVSQNGQPVVAHEPKADGTDFRAVFVRRADHEAVGLTYTVKFSADLVNWQTSTVTPTVLGTDGTHEAVSVPYPPFIGGKKARFFTVGVDAAP